MKDIAYEYLNRDRLTHMDMLETLRRGMGRVLYADDGGVAVINGDYTYMISTEDEQSLKKICAMINRPELIAMHQARFVPFLQEFYAYKYKMECFQCAYLSDEKLDEKLPEGIELRMLTMSERDFVVEHYDHPADAPYIAERIEAGMIGAYCGGECAGFIGTHSEGTMGILEVLPKFRRRGIAYTLEVAMINRIVSKGCVPLAHIVTTNKASMELQEKLGLSFSDKIITWLYDE